MDAENELLDLAERWLRDDAEQPAGTHRNRWQPFLKAVRRLGEAGWSGKRITARFLADGKITPAQESAFYQFAVRAIRPSRSPCPAPSIVTTRPTNSSSSNSRPSSGR